MMPGRGRDSRHSRVKVFKSSVAQPHPLVGNHPTQLGGVAGRQEGVGQVDELSRLATAQALLGPGEGAVDGVISGHQDVAGLKRRERELTNCHAHS